MMLRAAVRLKMSDMGDLYSLETSPMRSCKGLKVQAILMSSINALSPEQGLVSGTGQTVHHRGHKRNRGASRAAKRMIAMLATWRSKLHGQRQLRVDKWLPSRQPWQGIRVSQSFALGLSREPSGRPQWRLHGKSTRV